MHGYGSSILGESVPDRYRQSQAQSRQIPTTTPAASIGVHVRALRTHSYAQGRQQYVPRMQNISLECQPQFLQDIQGQQQSQSFSSDTVYKLPTQAQSAQQTYCYDPMQQYQPQQSTAIEALSNQLSVPQYYYISESTSTASQISQTYASAQHQPQPSFQQSLPSNGPSEERGHVNGVDDCSQLNTSNVLGKIESSQDSSASEKPYKTYLETLKQMYQYTFEGRLVEAGQRLLEISDWLIGHATELGLTRDEPELQSQRLKLWTDFNNCWLTVLQRQKDIHQEMIDSGQPLLENQTLLQEDFLERMARELVRICDVMERHGLVDYEIGVWEEEIMDVLLDCLHLLEGDPKASGEPTSRLNPLSQALYTK